MRGLTHKKVSREKKDEVHSGDGFCLFREKNFVINNNLSFFPLIIFDTHMDILTWTDVLIGKVVRKERQEQLSNNEGKSYNFQNIGNRIQHPC